MANPRDPREMPTTAANKSSAMRWTIEVAAVCIIGVIAWWLSGLPRGESPDLTPRDESGHEADAEANQPPAVILNQDTGGGPPAAPEPAGAGTQ